MGPLQQRQVPYDGSPFGSKPFVVWLLATQPTNTAPENRTMSVFPRLVEALAGEANGYVRGIILYDAFFARF